jgi:YVTN family beta-propeller protein
VINTRSGAIEATLPSGIGPFSVATSPNDNSVYVADLGPGKLVVINTRGRQVSSTVTLGSYGTDPFTAAATRHAIYVTNQGANTLSVIDPRTLHVVTTVRTGNSPYGVAVVPGHHQ